MGDATITRRLRGIGIGLGTALILLSTAIPAWAATPQTFVVTTTTDDLGTTCDAICSLRQAIGAANANAAALDTITFSIPGTGPHTIAVSSALPQIDDPVIIDGTTEPDFSSCTAGPVVEISGTSAGTANGLWLNVSATIRGLAINGFSAPGQSGIVTIGASGQQIECNRLGTDPTGTIAKPNSLGIFVQNSATVGGTDGSAGNVISGNEVGVYVAGSGATILGNRIGTNAAGTAPLANVLGIFVDNGSNNAFGGTAAGAANLISGNERQGIRIQGPGNQILGNRIGTDATGTIDLGNGRAGVEIGSFGGADNTVVGGTTPSAGNIIAFNDGPGVLVLDRTNNPILGNSIFSNGSLGIDLGGGPVTLNDPDDSDEGPNHLQNFPVLTDASGTTVSGTIDSAADTEYRIEVFSNAACDPLFGHGEGQTLIAVESITTEADGEVSFAITLSQALNDGEHITATATDPAGNTSEFSACRLVQGNKAPVANPQTVTTAEDTAVGITLTGSDADGDPLTFSVQSGPAHGGLSGPAPNLTYAPTANFNGADSFTFTVNDGTADSAPATVSIAVTAVNDPPAVTNPGDQNSVEGEAISLQIEASDQEGSALTYSASGLPGGLSINSSSGLISGTLTNASSGVHSVTITVSDGSASSDAQFTWNVSGPAEADVAVAMTGDATAQTRGEITYQIVASNNGPDPATNTQVTDVLPNGLVLKSVTTPVGACSGSTTVTCQLGTVAVGNPVTVTLVVWAVRAGFITNTVTIDAAQLDGVSSNDSALFTTSVTGSTCSHVGTAGNDVLNGTAGPDVICGLGGDDQLLGFDGADFLYGGDDNDLVLGGNGADNLFGENGNDTINGEVGFDFARYDNAPAPVDVSLLAGSATGGAGNDSITLVEGIVGSSWADRLTGDSLDNTIEGRTGDDVLDGGAGFDFCSYVFASGSVNVSLATGLTSGADGSDSLSGFQGVFGSEFNDILTGNSGSNTLEGNAGSDSILGGSGFDFASYRDAPAGAVVNLTSGTSTGGHGNDALTGIEGVYGSSFNDTLTGNANQNQLEGGAGNDVIDGVGGNDFLMGQAGNDTLTGGTGDDWLLYYLAPSGVTVSLATGVATGGDGSDTIATAENVVGSSFNDSLTGNAVANALDGFPGNDQLFGGAGIDELTGGDGDDTLWGDADNDTLIGGSANDVLNGGTGADRLSGGDGDDTVRGEADADTAFGGWGADLVTGGIGNDTLFGGRGGGDLGDANDQLFGGDGNDFLIGETGNDILNGEANDDSLHGSEGNDTINGGPGFDYTRYDTAPSGVTVSLATGGTSGSHGNDVITLNTVEGIVGSDFNDTLAGNGGANVIFGDFGADTISGGAGNDELIGGLGDSVVGDSGDTMFGGDGNDRLVGESGNDTLNGDAHDDYFVGGGGNDIINGGAGSDQIFGSAGTDTLDGGIGNDTISGGIGGGDPADAADTIRGGDGADTLFGNGGNDSIFGQAGNDVLSGQAGDDTLNGGAGTDTCVQGAGSGSRTGCEL